MLLSAVYHVLELEDEELDESSKSRFVSHGKFLKLVFSCIMFLVASFSHEQDTYLGQELTRANNYLLNSVLN